MGEGAVLLLVVAVIVVIIVCLIGFYIPSILFCLTSGLFFGIFLATILGTRIVHRHLHVIARENEANIYVVADLENPQEVACADEDVFLFFEELFLTVRLGGTRPRRRRSNHEIPGRD